MKKAIHNLAALMLALLWMTNGETFAQRRMENLDRGLVAVKVANGVFVSWRVLGTDVKDIAFNLYRGATKVNANPITGATNLTDAAGTATSVYTVRPVVGGVEQAVGGSADVWANQSLTVNLKRPDGATNASGAYTYSPCDASVGDLDGDGQYEIVLKWDPSNSKDNSQAGYTGNVYLDAYELNGTFLWRIDLGVNIRAGAHYTQFLVGDYDCDGKAEIACKTAPGTKDGTGAFLSKGPAANDNDAADYRNNTGYILTGPEYVTLFNGQTGKEMASLNYTPARGVVSKETWGDGYGNRVDRFLATNAYLDGVKPSMVFQRGYYTRMNLTAYDWDGTNFTQRWAFDSNNAGSGAAKGQGNHNLSCADVDGDGLDEILEGACAIDHNGKLLYATGLGHGDAIHIGDMDLDNPGLEMWEVHEEKTATYAYEFHDLKTGKILWGGGYGVDNGRGMACDIVAASPGYEMWSAAGAGIYSSKGVQLNANKPSMNFRVYWDGDLQDELLDGVKLDKWNGNGATRLITLPGTSCNGTKATPNLCADILGDWREEVITHDGASKLYITTTTIGTTNKMYTLMHDPVYRNAVSWQMAAYNQPPHLGFFLGNGIDKVPTPNIVLVNGNPANKVPTVGLSIPNNNTLFTNPATITLTATAADIDGTIVKVEFYNGTTLLAAYTAAPYVYAWKNVPVGSYSISAKATDNKGAVTTSAPLAITVVNATIDCNGTVGGTAYLDNCSQCVGGTTGKTDCATMQAEDACSYLGVTENINLGFTGSSYINTDNIIGAHISFAITATNPTTMNLNIRYANGGTDTRPADVMVNSIKILSATAFPSTVAWATWDTITLNIPLVKGLNTIKLAASSATGLANIDKLWFNDASLSFTSCTKQLIDLQTGWNLMSINVQLTDSSIANIFSGLDVQEIKTMDSFWRKDQNDMFNSLHAITSGNGYLVNMNETVSLTLTGIPMQAKNIVSLQTTSWQLIGVPYQQTTSLSVPFNANNCSVVKNFNGFWMPKGTANSIQNLEPSEAYFIKK